MPTESSPTGRGHDLFSRLKHGSSSLLRTVELRPHILVDEMMNIILSGYQTGQDALLRCLTRRVTETVALEESLDLESQPGDVQEYTTTSQERVDTDRQSLPDSSSAFEADDPIVAQDAAPDEEHNANRTLIFRSNFIKIGMAVLAIGVLLCILVPGVVLGVAMKQILMGIVLSSAIATIIDVLSPLAISGLHQQPTLDNMGKYNMLQDDTDQPHVAEVFITGLKTIIKELNVQNKFGLHLIYGHVKLAKGMVMIGKPMNNLHGLWTHPTKADQLDLGTLHGYLFVLGANEEIHPYEFRPGSLPPMTANDNAFITAAQKHLQLNGLTGIIGIELLDQDTLGRHMKEFVLSDTDGIAMLPADAEITDLKGNVTSHAKTTKGTHEVFIDGKALPDMEGNSTPEEVIIEALREAGIVN
ncbi:uncharacterized protein J7T55_000830 [Diaporthe amygdali]|uniref:uncharacterized protein n=1 Tax=Phomopsis amygdali TaxID=1214568 RepID=UPI0022FDFE3F|nr:uncharacterized protein J7T55_000830 [Diaporthe amygdali]KAJ0119980.1 uncharacterized protein J7T55_000830 [Diaporthe amygdali]